MLIPGGRVLIRNAFSGRTEGIPWLRYFEHVRPFTETRWPTVKEVLAAFEPAGFTLEQLQPVEETTALSLAEYAHRVGRASGLDTGGDLRSGLRSRNEVTGGGRCN